MIVFFFIYVKSKNWFQNYNYDKLAITEEKEFGQFLDFCAMTYFLNCD